VALNDLDGDGLPNDICYLDVRTDQVIVTPAPGTGARYQTFALDAGPLYRRETMAPMGCLPGDMNEWPHGSAGVLLEPHAGGLPA
jgi:enediyne biosynthesis protein E4